MKQIKHTLYKLIAKILRSQVWAILYQLLGILQRIYTNTMGRFFRILGRLLRKLGFYLPTKRLLASATLLAFIINLFLPLIANYLNTVRWNVTASYSSI